HLVQKHDAIGSIAQVEMVNFMCHTYLSVNLGPNINFIVGHNGSGKSAILTALAVCLGGRATFTNRASSIKQFLKEGTPGARVKITIRNEGDDAYKPQVYGDAVVVERIIRREGTSSYKIMAKDGTVISNKRDELTAICDHMQIQPSNPMTILTQDSARSFLANSTPSDKYKFFLNGSQLTQLSADYSSISNSVALMHKVLGVKRQVLPDMRRNVSRLENTLKTLDQAQHLEKEIEDLKKQAAWAQIEEQEQEVEVRKQAVAKAQQKVENVQANIMAREAELADMIAEFAALDQELKEHEHANQPLHDEKKRLSEEMLQFRKQIREFESEEQDMRSTMDKHRRARDNFQRRIQEEMMKLAKDGRLTRERQLEAIQNLEARKAELETRLHEVMKRDPVAIFEIYTLLNQLQIEGERIGEAHREAEMKYREARNQLRQFDGDIQSCRERITNLSRQQGNKLTAFGGPSIPRVVEMINDYQRQGKWRGQKPMGPLGVHVKLLRQEYASVIETLLGGTLNSFAVDNHQDLMTLKGILDQCRCSILKYSHEPIRYEDSQPSEDLTTVLRCLEVTLSVLFKMLILHHRSEQIVLVMTRDEGNRLTAGQFPRNVLAVYTQDCFQMGHRGGGYSTSSMQPYRGQPRLVADISSVVREEEGRMQQIQREKSSFAPAVEAAKENIMRVQQDRQRIRVRSHVNCLNAETGATHNELTEKSRQIRQMHDELAVRDFPHEYKEEEQIELIQRQFEALNEQRLEVKAMEDPIRQKLSGLEDQRKKALRLHEELTALNRRIDKDQELAYRRERLPQHQERLMEFTTELQVAQERLEADTKRCEEYCERVSTNGRRTRDIERMIQQNQARLREMESRHGSREDVYHEYVTKKAAFKKAEKEIGILDKVTTEVKDTLKQRYVEYSNFLHYISSRAKLLFSEFMRKRGYRGRLELNHTDRLLNLRVVKENNSARDDASQAPPAKDAEKDPRSLSGGEKSYATVCLLLSLWESMGSPFRALDEFDVFMDAVNRKVSMETMIENARQKDRPCQYIFITPQTMGNVPGLGSPDVRVHRLLDPERGQTQLDRQSQAA
ncbi:P-loop containing nucleoside triphosphate hydrolase protein, partial [Phlyctochytrium arcticum]